MKDFLNSIFVPLLYQPLFNALVFLAWLIPGHSIGWAIIALTVLIRLLLLPSANQTFAQQARMKALQPKLNDLKEKHGEDKQAHSKALMELYAAEKFNPFGGCLPSLVQLPILIVLYRVFVGGLNTDHFNLLYSFTPHMDTINALWFGLDLTKPNPIILPVLAGIAQFFQARQMSSLTAAPSGKGDAEDVSAAMSKQFMYIFPIMTIFIARQLPAAMSIYWIIFSLFSIVHHWWYFRDDRNLPEPGVSKTKEGVTVSVRQRKED